MEVILKRKELEKLNKKMTWAGIAEKYGLSTTTIHRFMQSEDEETTVRPRGKRKPKVRVKTPKNSTQDKIAAFVKDLRDNGVSTFCLEVDEEGYEFSLTRVEEGQG